jgi:hypothetical protein
MAGPEVHPHAIPEPAIRAFDMGAREFVLGNNEAAVTHLTEAVAAHNDFSDALYLLGLAQLRLGAAEAAGASLKKAADTTGNPILRDYALRKLEAVSAGTADSAGAQMEPVEPAGPED